jgi:hypothetical protein
MKTAVDFLVKGLPMINWEDPFYSDLLEQANKMFEQQIIDAYTHDRDLLQITAEQYYNKTYDKKL